MAEPAAGPSRLCARPPAHGATPPRLSPGTVELTRGALLTIPPRPAAGEPCPLLVLFHGAGSTAAAAPGLFAEWSGDTGAILSPRSPPARRETSSRHASRLRAAGY